MRKLTITSIILPLIAVYFISISCRNKNSKTDFRSFDYELYPIQSKDFNWGFMNTSGEIVIPSKYDYCSYFKEGMSLIKTGSGYGYINTKGDLVVDTIYSRASIFSEGLAAVTLPDSSICFINKESKVEFGVPFALKVSVFQDDLARFQDFNRKYGFIDKKGHIVIQAKYDFISSFSEGLACFCAC